MSKTTKQDISDVVRAYLNDHRDEIAEQLALWDLDEYGLPVFVREFGEDVESVVRDVFQEWAKESTSPEAG